jgi:hypothetical protein
LKKLLVVLVMLVGAVQIYLHADSGDDVHGPVVVKKLALVNQVATIPATLLTTPTVDGDYEVMVYEELLATDPTSFGQFAPVGLTPKVSWTDDIGAQNTTNTDRAFGVGAGVGTDCECPRYSFSLVIHAKAGTPIQFAGQYFPGSSTSPVPVDVFVTLTKF